MDINLKEYKIINEFKILENWEEKYEYLINIGKKSPGIPEKEKKEKYLIKGCQSKVWLKPKLRINKIFLETDSDTLLTKGMASLLNRIYSGSLIENVIKHNIKFIYKIGFNEFLSPIRANGILLMIKQIKLYAIVFKNILS